MIQFYTIYKDDEIVTSLVMQLSWTNNLLILSGTKSKEERHFYLKLSIKNNYSKRELDRQISSAYYERYMLSNGNNYQQVSNIIDLMSKLGFDTFKLLATNEELYLTANLTKKGR